MASKVVVGGERGDIWPKSMPFPRMEVTWKIMYFCHTVNIEMKVTTSAISKLTHFNEIVGNSIFVDFTDFIKFVNLNQCTKYQPSKSWKN